MKIRELRLTGLSGGTVEGGWAEELAPEDNVHTVVEVTTDEGLTGIGSTFTSSHLVKAAARLLEPFLLGELSLIHI
jgi:D-galactarolactone cycloisomerase